MIRIGLMLDGTKVARWEYEVLQAICQTGRAKVTLTVIDAAGGVRSANGKFNIRHAAFLGYQWVDRLLFRDVNDPFEMVDCGTEITASKVMRIIPQRERFSDQLELKDVAAIQAENIDILLRFGFRMLQGPILDVPKYGVWCFHHGDSQTHRGEPPCFWEVAEDYPVTGLSMQILSERLGEGTLANIWCSTDRLSLTRTRAELYWNCIQMLPRLIERLDKGGLEALRENGKTHSVQFYDCRPYRHPNNVQTFIATLRILSRIGAKVARKRVSKEQWRLMYALEEDLGKTAIYRYQQLVPPKDRFWADPFVIKRNGHFYIFVEEYIYSSKRGHISVITLDERGNRVSDAKVVLREDHHLSYPFLLEVGGQLLMIPEASECRAIWAYECTEFPFGWQRKQCLMEGVIAVDPTIFFHNGRWWMFVNMADRPDMPKYTHLHLFHSTDPTSNRWLPHSKNPVVSDARRSRPAGKPFVRGGHLYRPSQDCAGAYGRGISINRVVTLDENNYEEVAGGSIGPNLSRKQIGIHTLNRCEQLTIVDALFRVPIFG